MYDIWLSYLATRMQLFLDLERLPLDSRGVWTEEFRFSPDPTERRAAAVGLPARAPILPPAAAAALEL